MRIYSSFKDTHPAQVIPWWTWEISNALQRLSYRVIMIIIKGIIPYDDIDKDIRCWFGPFRCDDMDLPDRQQAYRNCKRIQQGYFCKRLIPETDITLCYPYTSNGYSIQLLFPCVLL
jgi:hypothetical protein